MNLDYEVILNEIKGAFQKKNAGIEAHRLMGRLSQELNGEIINATTVVCLYDSSRGATWEIYKDFVCIRGNCDCDWEHSHSPNCPYVAEDIKLYPELEGMTKVEVFLEIYPRILISRYRSLQASIAEQKVSVRKLRKLALG